MYYHDPHQYTRKEYVYNLTFSCTPDGTNNGNTEKHTVNPHSRGIDDEWSDCINLSYWIQ